MPPYVGTVACGQERKFESWKLGHYAGETSETTGECR